MENRIKQIRKRLFSRSVRAGILVTFFMATGIMESVAFCGFYVAKADATLFNNKSQVILVRDGRRSVITMANDFKGDVKDFAMVVPVPVVLGRHDIRTIRNDVFEKLDAYSAPRMVEYHDENPCEPVVMFDSFEHDLAPPVEKALESTMVEDVDEELQVTIEAEYQVDEYDILILSAKESDGLETWLKREGYKIPEKASAVLAPYIKSQMKFFVVKVNMDKMKDIGNGYIRPIQISFESDKFMLPIRLGMANSKGSQDMVVYAFTRTGRIETTNYRTVKIPSNRNIPLFVERDFGKFYKNLFDKSYRYEAKKAVFLEYAWNVSPNAGVKCDPCVAPPPIFADFKEAGVDWVSGNNWNSSVFFTRLHVRYTRDKFPQDLQFQVTPNRENYQGRYIITHPATGDLSCEAGEEYLRKLEARRQNELDELAVLTDWDTDGYQSYVQKHSRRYHKAFEENNVVPLAPGSGTDGPGNNGPTTIEPLNPDPVNNPLTEGPGNTWLVLSGLLGLLGLVLALAAFQLILKQTFLIARSNRSRRRFANELAAQQK